MDGGRLNFSAMSTTTERDPLLTTSEVARKSGGLKEHECCLVQWVIDFYEAKIISGELIVAKKVSLSACPMTRPRHWKYGCCGTEMVIEPRAECYCFNCGARIVNG